MSGTPTIVLASLSDDKLKESINSLVKHVNEKMEEMVESTNSAVKRMEDKLKSLGSLKIDTGGSNDGGTGRRTQQHEKLTKAVNDASEAVSKETQKLQDLQQSLSGASDREQNFISQKERAANTISKENELLQRQEQELANLKSQQSSFVGTNQQTTASIDKQRESVANLKNEVKYWQSIVSQMQSGDKKLRFNSLWLGDTTSKQGHDILDVANKLYSIMQKLGMETEKGSASTSQAVRAAEELAKYYKISREEAEKLILSVQESPLARGKYTTHYDTRFGLDNLTMQQKTIDDFALRKELAQGKLTFETDNLTLANKRLEESEKAVASASSQRSQLDSQIAAKEKEIAETKGRIATATREQTEAEKNASQAAKEKANILSQVANQEKQVAEAKKQLTTATQQQTEVEKQSVQNVAQQTAARDKQIKKNQEAATSFDNFAKAQQVAIRSANPSDIRNADTLQTMNIQLDLLRERLREARQQYSSFVALAAHATTTGDKGLFQYATDGVHRYEQEVRSLIPQIRTLQSGIQQMGDVIAPQGHTIQNYVNSLQKANPELAALNAKYKSGTSLLQDQSVSYVSATQSAQRYTEEIRKQAQAIRESQQWKEKGFVTVGNDVFYDPARSKAQTLSLEEQMLNAENRRIEAQEKLNAESQKEVEIKSQLPKQGYLFDGNTRDESSRQQQSRAALERYKQIQQEEQNVNSLNAAIMRSLHIGKDEVKNYDIRTASAKQLNAMLKQQRDAYANLTTSQRSQKGGVELAESIQRTGRALQKLQAAASRPISLQFAMGLSEKTLDEMAYKMRQLASYRSGLNIKTQANEIEQVNKKYAELQKMMNDIMRKNNDMIASNTALGRSWNYMKNRLAFYFTIGASTQFIKNLIEVRSQYEMNERALGILINSAERGTQIFNELSQMALVSPYTLIELSSAAKQLTAYDIAAKDVVDTTRRLADMASAVGIPIERLTYALGQIKAYGYLNSRDARMFANAGIPLVKQLSDYYTQLEGRLVSTADVYDRIKKKTIDYEQVVQVINKMTDEGGKFFDFQAKMADTLKVRLANLTLAWNNMLNDMGSSNQGVLTTGIGLLRDMFLHWKDLESAISKVATAFGIYKTAQLVTLIWTGRITTAMGVQELVGKKLQARFASLTIAQKGFVSAATAGWAALAFIVADAWLTISRNMEEIEQLNKSIADGAKESYEAIDKMLHSSEMVSTRLSAAQGKLSDTDAAKAWEMLREQIELSAASSKELIAQLLKEPDINKRVTESFNLAEKIEEANRKLSDLNDSLDVSQNSILGGLFGEGLAEDIDDYNSRIKYTSDVAEWASKKNRGFWENAAMGLTALFNEVKDTFGSDANEAQDEIKNFAQKAAQAIKDELGEEGIKDKIQVNEAIARVVRGMEQQFPQIRGKGKVLFETIFYDTMATEFKGAVDGQAYYYEKFLEQLKKDHASAFSGVTEDINKETFKWSSAQIDAIQKTADKVKRDLPAASQGAIDEILRQLNSTDFKVRIVAEMTTTSLDNVQKQFREKFIEKPWIANDKEREKAENEANQRYGTLMRKNTESNAEYEKRISDERKKQLELSQKNADIITKNKGKQEEFSKAVLADAQKQKEAADDWLKAAKDIEYKGGYDFSTKGENSAARKAAKQAESELAKALKDELSTIDKVRSIYKDLTKEGMSHANAVERAARGWDETVNAINRVLQKNGLQKLDLSKFAGIENPRELVNMLQSQLNTLLKRGAKPAEIKELQTKVNTLEVDADKYDLTKITKGLNNELGKLKDEYELAVELDANPELGGIFADYMGIDLKELPKNAEEAAKKAQQYIDKILRENSSKENIDIASLMGKDAFDKWIKSSGHSVEDDIVKVVDNYRQALHKMQVDESKKQMQEWDKLLEKYAEYEYKVTQIQKEAERERETARKKGASQEILDAIDERERQELAKLSFEEFQKSPEWIVATGDLANMSKSAIGMLIEQLEKYKRSAKNLSPKQIKQLNSALSKLYKEQRKNNPFKAISNMLDEAKERMATFDEDINKTQKEIDNLTKKKKENIVEGVADEETDNKLKKAIERLKELKKAREETGEVDASSWVSSINETIGAVQSAIGVFDDLAKAIGGVENSDLDKVFSVIDKAGQGAAVGAQIGGGYGAIIGAVAGAATGLISIFASAANERITAKVEESERAVKRLELAYIDLEHAVQHAYGMATIGANMAAKANKELQLVELKRQLALERSRDSKNRDEDKIIDLQKQIKELEYDIADSVDSIVDDLLGISSVGDAMENMMDAFVEALRNGEDAMATFDESVDEMIANMVKKMFTTKILQPWFEEQWSKIQDQINERAGKIPNKLAEAQSKVSEAKMADLDDNNSLVEALRILGFSDEQINLLNWYDEFGQLDYGAGRNARLRAAYEKALKEAEKKEAEIQKELATATMPTTDDIRQYAELLRTGQPVLEGSMQEVANFLRELGLMKDDASKNLSALQQGISGITEDTAGALEAITNGISQQSYLQSDLLTQIRDAVVGIDMDVQVATQAQMLLQLQQSYTVQMAIQGILEGVLNPSGRAFSVELVS